MLRSIDILYTPDSCHQILMGYYLKYYNPAYEVLAMETDILSDQQWAITKGLLDERRTKFIETPDYGISHAIVFSNEREIFRKNGVTYLQCGPARA